MLNLLAAGILALPAVLVVLVTIPVIAVLSLPAAYLLLARKQCELPKIDASTSHVIVTGGSSGIGQSIAISAAKMGVQKVTILARNKERLDQAKAKILEANNKCMVEALSVDVTDATAVEKAANKVLKDGEEGVYLFCCAGEPHPDNFEDVPPALFHQLSQINHLGTVYTAKAFLARMQSGTICFCSSAAGQVGVFGYTAYTPTKFALRGLAESLHQELVGRPIHVQVAYPSDTDTPGFAKENLTKPEETRLISETASLMQPEHIGSRMLKAAMSTSPAFAVYFDLDGFILSNLTAGFAPVTGLLDAVAQLSATTFFRWVAVFYLKDWHRIIGNCQRKRAAEKVPVRQQTTVSETDSKTK